MNHELIKKIHDVVGVEGVALDMGLWEGGPYSASCGTTRCIAGWAIHLTTGKEVLKEGRTGSSYVATEYLHPETIALAERRGIDVHEGISPDLVIERLAADLLGLEREGRQVFYTDDYDALQWLAEHSREA